MKTKKIKITKLPHAYFNTISYIGTIIALINILFIISLFFITTYRQSGGPYTGIYIYMVLPSFLLFGLILIPIGMIIKIRKSKTQEKKLVHKKMIIDLNDSRHRNALLIFLTATIFFIFYISYISYEAFHYTESNEFCGKLCHTVMEPEYTAYQNLSHANVPCVECHIGSGADWFVRAKISGMYQVYSVLLKKYPKPIPTPIEHLRPARETCEHCHWPQKFTPNLLISEKHYLSDEQNTEWNIHLRMKIGSSHSSMGLQEGIHWHINKDVKIEYIPSSPDRENIPWVKYINLATGDTIIYEDPENPISEEDLLASAPRIMDCMDCHNRPTHNFLTPQNFIDNAIAAGDIPQNLPRIKEITMQILTDNFDNTDTALQIIENKILDFYKENYPDIFSDQRELVDKAISGVHDEFQKNMFPEMRADWDSYPDHIGHIEYNGCFRCHNDNHKSEDGRTITKDCNLCHTILTQGEADSLEVTSLDSSLEFRHPVNIDNAWKEALCADCHRYLY